MQLIGVPGCCFGIKNNPKQSVIRDKQLLMSKCSAGVNQSDSGIKCEAAYLQSIVTQASQCPGGALVAIKLM